MDVPVKLESFDTELIIKSIKESIETLQSIETLEQAKHEVNSLEEQNSFCEDDNEPNLVSPPATSVFTCYHCGSDYVTKSDIRLHLKDGYCNGVRCFFYWRYFPNKKSVRTHLLKSCLKLVSPASSSLPDVCATELRKCKKCSNSFLLKEMRKHKNEFHSKKVEFEACRRTFTSKDSLKQHQLIHTGVSSFECESCKKKFRDLAQLRRHEKRHMAKKVTEMHKCTICGKQLTTSSSLVRHKTSCHSNERPFSCDVCGCSFKLKRGLRDHGTTVHCNERNFICGICNRAFKTNGTLKKHLKIHSADKPFQCKVTDSFEYEICQKSFCSNQSLKQHKLLHAGVRNFECETCGKRFVLRKFLEKHQLVHFAGSFECDICRKRFHLKKYLKQHQLFHANARNFECETCKKRFIARHHLKRHQLIHSGYKSYICGFTTCGKRLSTYGSLKRHQLIHSGEKPYICEFCGKTFHQACILKSHQLTKHIRDK